MSKTGIVAYILAAIFVGFCFWIVGCASPSSSDSCLDPGNAENNLSQDSTMFTCGDGVFHHYE